MLLACSLYSHMVKPLSNSCSFSLQLKQISEGLMGESNFPHFLQVLPFDHFISSLHLSQSRYTLDSSIILLQQMQYKELGYARSSSSFPSSRNPIPNHQAFQQVLYISHQPCYYRSLLSICIRFQ